ncbi:proline/glycine betaine ABC transporter permease [Isoptericola variabilis]|uniref:ABC-type transporter, integral membrane subunit n=1 Tax=Isoptericola variabilis (strain 225) TaxID=743718 RepID=F6FRM9_ISOV2|nr:proline/glycine betaine ABC transporter permease [Isoptericola variabilis]AEG45087.1 ABC-type transporter, integral membrane subunit [Isoptericola variabilis 225]TWH26217.1 glycine betaine/proline transport system permease protein [Isoptericola variabilis J7]
MNPDTLVPRIPLGDAVADVVDWFTVTFRAFFRLVKDALVGVYDLLDLALTTPPDWVVALVLASVAYAAKGWRLAVGSLLGFALILGTDQWGNAMDTLALVLVASLIALAVAIPLGIWAARADRVSTVVKPVLDFMQTMPAFVYLIPTVVIFLTGPVPGIVATVIFAMAPGVRFTELGIRQVDSEVVEAGHAFGATPGRILRQIQLPLAAPTLMAGVNQVIMLSLSMVVIAGMVGAGGLGNEVVAALQRVDVSLGVEAGLAVVILAIYLDRVTSGLANRAPVARALARAAA